MTTMRRRRPTVEQESYFVSMTDLMIGLLFVFIIMLMAFALNYRQAEGLTQEEQERLEAAVAAALDEAARQQQAKEEADAARRLAEQRERQLAEINRRLTDNRQSVAFVLEHVERSLMRQGIQVRIDPETGILRLPDDVLFDSGAAILNLDGRRAVATLAEALEAVVPCFARPIGAAPVPTTLSDGCPADRFGRLEAVLVEGHTDDVPITSGRFRSNWDLSTVRAIATFEALRAAWPGVDHLSNDRGERLVGVSGYGEERPVADNTDEEGRRANRRIDLRFLMAAPQLAETSP